MISRIVIAGSGSSGKRYLKLLRERFPEAEIRMLRHRLGSPTVEDSDGNLEDIASLQTFNPEIAILANPSTNHLEIASTLAKLNIHQIIEKPLAYSGEGLDEFLSICNPRDVVILVGYNLRYSKSLIEFKKILDMRNFGRILSVRIEVGQYLPDWRENVDYRTTVSSSKCLGGGAISELSHELDYLMWLFGKIIWIQADLVKVSKLDIDVEDLGHFVMRLEGAQLENHTPAILTMDLFRREAKRECTVICETGTIVWNGISENISIYSAENHSWHQLEFSDYSKSETYGLLLDDFINRITLNEFSNSSLIGASNVVRVMDAARESSASGRRVYPNYNYEFGDAKYE